MGFSFFNQLNRKEKKRTSLSSLMIKTRKYVKECCKQYSGCYITFKLKIMGE